MSAKYDVIICGTGLTECILSALFSVKGKQVLCIDRNSYNGGTCATFDMQKLFDIFRIETKPPSNYGPGWNADFTPKPFMNNSRIIIKIR